MKRQPPERLTLEQMRALNEFLRAIGEPENPPYGGIWQCWWLFHHRRPEVYAYLNALIHEMWRRNWRHYGIRPLCERVRWHFQYEKDEREEFKLNDHYLSRYARFLIHEHPDFDGFFALRELKSA